MKKIGQNIRKNRLNQNLKQRELAEKSDMTRGAIAMIETGKQNIPVTKLFKIAESLSVEAYELLQ